MGNLNDKEIASMLGGSQQNISKHRLKALAYLRQSMIDSEERGDKDEST